MRPRFIAEENLNGKIVSGVFRREPAVDIWTAKTAGILGIADPAVLAVAARENRILVSHDRETMPSYFRAFVARNASPGLVIVSQTVEIRQVIEDIVLLWASSEASEWRNQIVFLPL